MAKGLWIEILSFMSRSKPKGYLLANGKQNPGKTLAKLTGETEETIDCLLSELRTNEVFSETADGVIFSRRMVKEAKLSELRAEIGRKGGHAKSKALANAKQNDGKEDGQAPGKPEGESGGGSICQPFACSKTLAKQDLKNKNLRGSSIQEKKDEEGEIIREGGKASSKANKKKPDPDPEDIRLVQILIDLMARNNPTSYILQRLTEYGQEGWINQCRFLRTIDKRTPAEIEAVIRFSQNDEFWQGNILSMGKLRQKWDQLWFKMNRGTGGRSWTESRTAGIREWLAEEKAKDKDGGDDR